MLSSNKAVTLIEILMVVVIVGILVALALPNLTRMRERTFDREAQVNLRLIQAAQRIYRMERGFYFPETGSQGTSTTNTALKLHLPTGDGRNWDYTCDDPGDPSSFTSRAERLNPPSGWDRTWQIDQNSDPDCIDGNCP